MADQSAPPPLQKEKKTSSLYFLDFVNRRDCLLELICCCWCTCLVYWQLSCFHFWKFPFMLIKVLILFMILFFRDQIVIEKVMGNVILIPLSTIMRMWMTLYDNHGKDKDQWWNHPVILTANQRVAFKWAWMGDILSWTIWLAQGLLFLDFPVLCEKCVFVTWI